jgi:hypothetical protein
MFLSTVFIPKTDNPEMKSQVTRTLARMWKELSKVEQKEWSDSVTDEE